MKGGSVTVQELLTAAAAALSLILTALGVWKRSDLISWLGGAGFILFLAGMLLLRRPWQEMLLPGLLLLSISGAEHLRGKA